jgi:hypothetical protein
MTPELCGYPNVTPKFSSKRIEASTLICSSWLSVSHHVLNSSVKRTSQATLDYYSKGIFRQGNAIFPALPPQPVHPLHQILNVDLEFPLEAS